MSRGSRVLASLLAAVGGAGLLAAACAPAAQGQSADQPAGAQQPAASASEAAATPASPRPSGQEPRFGGVLIESYSIEPPSFNPWEEAVNAPTSTAQKTTNQLVQYQIEGDYDKKDYRQLIPALAKTWEQAKDGLTWTFRLQEGVRWQDGTLFTCKDAKWSLDSLRTGQGLRRSPRAVTFRWIDSIQCADDLTLVVRMKAPHAALVDMIASGYNVVWPAHKYENNTDDLRKDPNIGSGPFIFKEYLPGEKIVFVRNPDYWRKPYPYLDGVEMRLLSTSASAAALRADRLDTPLEGLWWTKGQADTLAKECKDCVVYPPQTMPCFSAVNVNHQRPPWNRRPVLDALAYAIDRVKLIQVAEQGWGVPTVSIFPPETAFYLQDKPWVKAEIPGGDLGDPAGNKEKARRLLQDAGVKPGELTVPLFIWANVQERWVPNLTEDFQAVGFNVTTTLYDTARMYEIWTSGDFQVAPWNHCSGQLDPDQWLYEYYYTGSDRNYGRYSNPEVDKLIDQQSQTIDKARRVELVEKVGRTIMRENGRLVFHWSQNQVIHSGRMRNWLPAPYYHGPSSSFERVWLTK